MAGNGAGAHTTSARVLDCRGGRGYAQRGDVEAFWREPTTRAFPATESALLAERAKAAMARSISGTSRP
jgi:hypothetical protein